jgi:hypothetical protein
LYVPFERPDIVKLVPEPEMFPGFNIHDPDPGNPFKTTLPVCKLNVGCVIAPNVGGFGADGGAEITTSVDSDEIQPKASMTE